MTETICKWIFDSSKCEAKALKCAIYTMAKDCDQINAECLEKCNWMQIASGYSLLVVLILAIAVVCCVVSCLSSCCACLTCCCRD